jgi:hypothetical protein
MAAGLITVVERRWRISLTVLSRRHGTRARPPFPRFSPRCARAADDERGVGASRRRFPGPSSLSTRSVAEGPYLTMSCHAADSPSEAADVCSFAARANTPSGVLARSAPARRTRGPELDRCGGSFRARFAPKRGGSERLRCTRARLRRFGERCAGAADNERRWRQSANVLRSAGCGKLLRC